MPHTAYVPANEVTALSRYQLECHLRHQKNEISAVINTYPCLYKGAVRSTDMLQKQYAPSSPSSRSLYLQLGLAAKF